MTIPCILRCGALRSTICGGRNLGRHAVRASGQVIVRRCCRLKGLVSFFSSGSAPIPPPAGIADPTARETRGWRDLDLGCGSRADATVGSARSRAGAELPIGPTPAPFEWLDATQSLLPDRRQPRV